MDDGLDGRGQGAVGPIARTMSCCADSQGVAAVRADIQDAADGGIPRGERAANGPGGAADAAGVGEEAADEAHAVDRVGDPADRVGVRICQLRNAGGGFEIEDKGRVLVEVDEGERGLLVCRGDDVAAIVGDALDGVVARGVDVRNERDAAGLGHPAEKAIAVERVRRGCEDAPVVDDFANVRGDGGEDDLGAGEAVETEDGGA